MAQGSASYRLNKRHHLQYDVHTFSLFLIFITFRVTAFRNRYSSPISSSHVKFVRLYVWVHYERGKSRVHTQRNLTHSCVVTSATNSDTHFSFPLIVFLLNFFLILVAPSLVFPMSQVYLFFLCYVFVLLMDDRMINGRIGSLKNRWAVPDSTVGCE